jgi:hypothetical protein
MVRFYLRFSLLPLAFLTAMLLVIHAQPHDDHELRDLLLPEGCPAPCFLGIRPGVTTADEAVKLLEKSGWADHFQYVLYGTQLRLKWNNRSPSWLTNDGAYGGPVIWIQHGLVSEFRVDTNLSLGAIQLILGTSPLQKIYIEHREGGYKYLLYAVVYANTSMFTSVSNDCHGQANRFTYQDKIYLGYTQLTNIFDLSHTYHDSWADLMRMSCH